MDPTASAPNRNIDRRIYALVAIGFVLLTFAGFARTYYLRGIVTSHEISTLVHLHGITMTAWVMLFVTQVFLISSKRVKLHMQLGIAGIALAALLVIVGYFTSITAARVGTPSAPPDIPNLVFLIVPLGDLVMFVLFFGAAVYYRKKAANHKRLMLLTVITLLPPAIARIPIESLQSLGPLWFYGFPDAILLGLLAFDTWYNRRLNKIFAIGTVLLIASHPLRLIFGGTELWQNFAAWLVG